MVIIDVDDYIKKAKGQISDMRHYKELPNDSMTLRVGKIQ